MDPTLIHFQPFHIPIHYYFTIHFIVTTIPLSPKLSVIPTKILYSQCYIEWVPEFFPGIKASGA
jgi:hypothetical protein